MKGNLRLTALALMLILLGGCAAPIPSPMARETEIPQEQNMTALEPPVSINTSVPDTSVAGAPLALATALPSDEPANPSPDDEADEPPPAPSTQNETDDPAIDESSVIDVNPLYLVPNNKSAFDARELMVDDCYLGDSRMDVEAVLGKPARVRLTEDEYYYWSEYHYSQDVVLGFSSSSMDSSFILRSASIADPTLRGPRGIRVGDTLEKLLSSFMIRDVEMTDEQYDRIVWSRDFEEPLLYATVYDVEMSSSRLEENAPYTAVLKPWGYIRTAQDEDGEAYLQVVYADVLNYDPFDIHEYMTTEYDTSYLIFDIRKGHVTRFEWYTTIYA